MTAESLNRQRILVVDDNPQIASLLNHSLTGVGYQVSIACDGLAALNEVANDPPDLILLDLELPHLHGDEVCRRLKNDPSTHLIPIVMITARGERQNKLNAWDNGADEFLTKPFHLAEVITRCRSLLRIRRLIQERESAEFVVFALARAVEAKSSYTHGHSERVMRYCLEMAQTMGLTVEQQDILRKGALLHDIGKISIPDAILNKPGSLTEEEYDIIKQHPLQGAHIVEPLVSFRDALPLVRSHHERLDGQGYPDGLGGDEIPLLVRLLSVCDVYDSLSSERPYRGAIPHEHCLKILRESALTGGLDPELVALFTSLSQDLVSRRAKRGQAAPLVSHGA